MMAIDATWERECLIADISQTGARLIINGSIEGLALTEFFLILSRIGHAHRRCKLAWVNGDELGASFLQERPRPKDRLGRRQSAENAEPGGE
jgi:hypothetical protein